MGRGGTAATAIAAATGGRASSLYGARQVIDQLADAANRHQLRPYGDAGERERGEVALLH